MSTAFKGRVDVDIRDSVPDWAPFLQPKAPPGAPNVLMIVWDDVGYGAMDVFGGPIETPTMRRITDAGLRYANFHTTALCSPTRASLLTGRNATSNNMACVVEASAGFPGFSARIPLENGTLAEVLSERGWNTYAIGKWHLTPADELDMSAWKARWPLGHGFERFYGFLGGETNQWYPALVEDNHPIEQPARPENGYHLSQDLADQAIRYVRDAKMVDPDKPWFMYFCPGCAHAPHHVFKEWADRYRGRFDAGYEAIRERTLARQQELGLLPADVELSPINPHGEPQVSGPDGQPWPAMDVVRPWSSLTDPEQRVFVRMAEVYAGFVSYTDAQIGRLIDYLQESGQLENTIVVVVSDNGASAEGGPNGSVNEMKFFNGIPDRIEDVLDRIDELGSPTTYNHYPSGWAWAFGTPFPYWKRFSGYEGGVADVCLVSWPKGIPARGEVRDQYVHAVDVVPTIYDLLGIEPPAVLKGYTQSPLEGEDFTPALADPQSPGAGHAVLLDAGNAGAVLRRLARDHAAPAVLRLESFRPRRVGALPPGERPDPAAQRRGRAPRAARAPQGAVVLLRRGLSRAAARRPDGPGDLYESAPPSRRLARPVRVLPRHRRGAGGVCGQPGAPLVRDRRGRRHRHSRGRRGAARLRRGGGRPGAVPAGPSAALRLQLGGREDPEGQLGRRDSDRSARPCRRVRQDRRRPDRQRGRDAVAVRRHRTGRQPRDRNPAGGVRDLRWGERWPGQRLVGLAGLPAALRLEGWTIDRVVVDVSGEEYVDHEKEVLAYIARD